MVREEQLNKSGHIIYASLVIKKKIKPHNVHIISLWTSARLTHKTHAHIVLPKTFLDQTVRAVLYSEKDKSDTKWVESRAITFGSSSHINCPDNWLNQKVYVIRKEDIPPIY